MKIIGLTGTNGSGKDAVASYLKTKGYLTTSLSEMLREEAQKRKLSLDRISLQNLGNSLREEFGAGILAQRMIEKLELSNHEKVSVSSIRNPAEIDVLRASENFFLLGIDAKIETRYERVKKRKSLESAQNFDEFVKREEAEKTTETNKQQLDTCLDMSDELIENKGTLEELYAKVDHILRKHKLD